ncbi:MAG: N-glycosylase/DNA lyase [Candidatus Aenigmarchaeota archaeon]|nr:N-glycosylase/DNA lyase [Candidatus Aenigmarchaeota archaeon]
MKIESVIRKRLKEFENLGKNGNVEFDFNPFIGLKLKATIATELAFCISTANSTAVSGLVFQKSLENMDLEMLKRNEVEGLMKSAGVRFYPKKAGYVISAIRNFRLVKPALREEDKKARDILVKYVKGLGYKEASHFLRNIGRKDVAIIDRHILRWLYKNGKITAIPKTVPRTVYLRIEKILEGIARDEGMNLAELDLRLWFEMTGKVLK